LQPQQSTIIKTVAKKVNSFHNIVHRNSCIEPGSSSFYHFATPLRVLPLVTFQKGLKVNSG